MRANYRRAEAQRTQPALVKRYAARQHTESLKSSFSFCFTRGTRSRPRTIPSPHVHTLVLYSLSLIPLFRLFSKLFEFDQRYTWRRLPWSVKLRFFSPWLLLILLGTLCALASVYINFTQSKVPS